MLLHQGTGHPLRCSLVLRGAANQGAEQLRPVDDFRHRAVQARQAHHADDLAGAGGNHRLVERMGLQRPPTRAVRLHQHEVRQVRQGLIGQAAVYQLSRGGASGGADNGVRCQGLSQIGLRGVQHRGQVRITLKVGAGTQQHLAGELT